MCWGSHLGPCHHQLFPLLCAQLGVLSQRSVLAAEQGAGTRPRASHAPQKWLWEPTEEAVRRVSLPWLPLMPWVPTSSLERSALWHIL